MTCLATSSFTKWVQVFSSILHALWSLNCAVVLQFCIVSLGSSEHKYNHKTSIVHSPVTTPNFVLSSPSTCLVPSSLTSPHPHFVPLKLLFVPLKGCPTLPLPLSPLQVLELWRIQVATRWCPDCCRSHPCGQLFAKVCRTYPYWFPDSGAWQSQTSTGTGTIMPVCYLVSSQSWNTPGSCGPSKFWPFPSLLWGNVATLPMLSSLLASPYHEYCNCIWRCWVISSRMQ